MTITNPNGNIYPSIEEARLAFCPSRVADAIMCSDCPLSRCNNRHKIDCPDLCRLFPDEAAELMGCTIEFRDPKFEKLSRDLWYTKKRIDELESKLDKLTQRIERAVVEAASQCLYYITHDRS